MHTGQKVKMILSILNRNWNNFNDLIFKSWFFFNIFNLFYFTDTESFVKNDNCASSDNENGVDIENDDDLPMMSDMDGVDNDHDMNRPRKIRR